MLVSRQTLCDFARASRLEWLETNGTGAFAMGTVAGVNTRRYHALLIASLRSLRSSATLCSRASKKKLRLAAEHARWECCQYPGVELFGLSMAHRLSHRSLCDMAIFARRDAAGKAGVSGQRPPSRRDPLSLGSRVDASRAAVSRLSRLSFAGPLASQRVRIAAANRIRARRNVRRTTPTGITTSSICANWNAGWTFAKICSRPA